MRDIVRVLRRQAAQALRADRLETAADVLDRLEEEDPLAVETRGLRLEHLTRSGRLGEAQALAQQLLELFPDSAGIQLRAGYLAYAARDYGAALARFEESYRIHPHWRSRHQVGRTLTQLGRFEEAEAILLSLLPEHGICRRDLVWLYERLEDPPRALEACELFLREFPDDPLGRSQLRRLRAREATPEELEAEVESLDAIGETVSPDLIPEYCEKLLRSGQSGKVRAFVRARRAALDERVKTRIAWSAYHLQALDIACDLFADVFAAQRNDPKMMSALEAAARRIERLQQVIELYQTHAAENPRLYGRIKRLQRQLSSRPPQTAPQPHSDP